jgi:Domain of unknown function (DUF4372)
MNQGKLVFAQVMQHLPLTTLRRCVAQYRGEHKVKSFSCLGQFLCMAFAQLTYGASLRDIEACLRAQANKLYHMSIRGRPQPCREWPSPIRRRHRSARLRPPSARPARVSEVAKNIYFLERRVDDGREARIDDDTLFHLINLRSVGCVERVLAPGGTTNLTKVSVDEREPTKIGSAKDRGSYQGIGQHHRPIDPTLRLLL